MTQSEIVELAMRRVAAMHDCDILSPSDVLCRVAAQIDKINRDAPKPLADPSSRTNA